MQEVFEKIKERCMNEPKIGRQSLDAFLKIVNQVAEEYSHGHFGCNSNGEHEKCDGCGIAPECKEKYKHWFGVSGQWIPADEPPKDNKYVLLSFANFSVPMVGRYEEDPDGSGAYYLGDEDVPLVLQDMIVNAWMPLPKSYRPEGE